MNLVHSMHFRACSQRSHSPPPVAMAPARCRRGARCCAALRARALTSGTTAEGCFTVLPRRALRPAKFPCGGSHAAAPGPRAVAPR